MRRCALLGSFALTVLVSVSAAAPAGATTTTFDVSSDHANCNTVGGKITFATALHTGGPATAVNATVSGTLGGCKDLTNSSVGTFKGAYAAAFTGGTTDCATWFGSFLVSPLTNASLTTTWTPAKGQDFTPKTLVGTALKRQSTNVLQSWVSTVPSTAVPGVLYNLDGSFERVAAAGGPGAGEFASPNGAGLQMMLQSDYGLLFEQCAASTGVKSLTVGLGEFQIGTP